MGHHSPNRQWDMRRCSLFLLTRAWARGTGVNPRVMHKHLLFRRQATWDKATFRRQATWGVESKAFRSGLQGPRGMFT